MNLMAVASLDGNTDRLPVRRRRQKAKLKKRIIDRDTAQ
jgi:hypothetical protein